MFNSIDKGFLALGFSHFKWVAIGPNDYMVYLV